MRLTHLPLPSLLAILLLATQPTVALAYMGPGIGLGAITTSLGIIGAILLALISIVWYPVKRLVRRMRGPKPPAPALKRRLS